MNHVRAARVRPGDVVRFAYRGAEPQPRTVIDAWKSDRFVYLVADDCTAMLREHDRVTVVAAGKGAPLSKPQQETLDDLLSDDDC